MYKILDIHTHHPAPQPEAVICVSPDEFNPVEGQLYSVGIHPWLTGDDIPDSMWEALERAAVHPQVVAIGECGIDLVKGGPLYKQMLVMKRQVELSEKIGKPLVIHCVHAHDIVIGMRKDLKPEQNWAIHGFRGKPTVAAMFVKVGFWLSLGPVFNETSLGEIPAGRLLTETDESDVSIEEVITHISVLTGRDVRPEIERDSLLFLGLSDDSDNPQPEENPQPEDNPQPEENTQSIDNPEQ